MEMKGDTNDRLLQIAATSVTSPTWSSLESTQNAQSMAAFYGSPWKLQTRDGR